MTKSPEEGRICRAAISNSHLVKSGYITSFEVDLKSSSARVLLSYVKSPNTNVPTCSYFLLCGVHKKLLSLGCFELTSEGNVC